MRIELLYTPGCSSYKKALDVLETVIAEERLPIPVELVDSDSGDYRPAASHTIRVDGVDFDDLPVAPQGEYCRLYSTRAGISSYPCVERLREFLHNAWRELTSVAWNRV